MTSFSFTVESSAPNGLTKLQYDVNIIVAEEKVDKNNNFDYFGYVSTTYSYNQWYSSYTTTYWYSSMMPTPTYNITYTMFPTASSGAAVSSTGRLLF